MSLIQSNWRSAEDTDGQLSRGAKVIPDLHVPQDQPAQYETVQDLLAVLKKYRLTVLGVALGVFLLVLLGCLLMTPKYASTATIEVNRDAAAANNAGGPGDTSTQVDDVKTEVETDNNILQQPSLALAVIKKLDLAKHPPFNKAVDSKERNLPLDQAPITREKYLKLFAKSLKVESVPDTRLIQVTFRNQDPVVAANVVNTISEVFISDYLQRRVNSTSEVSFWIGKELETLKKQVESSEQALADFQHKTGLSGLNIAADGGGNGGVALQQHNAVLDRLNSLNQELTTAEANRISAEAVYKLMQTQDPEVVLGLGTMGISSGGSVLGQGGGLDLLRSLRAQEIPLKTQYADLATKYGAKNPRLLQLQNQIDALDGEVKAELKKITRRAENDYLYARQNEAAITTQMKAQQGIADKQTDDTVQLQVLAQEAFSNRKLYESLFSQLHQANVTAGIRATHLGIVDHGQVSGLPVIPNYLLALPIALLAGIFLGVVTAFIRQSMDHSVTVPQDVEDTVHVPVMAHLPLFANGKLALPVKPGDSVLISTPELPLSESFRSLRTSILLSRPPGKSKALLITSPLPGDGKSTVAFNLAVAFAQQGERVLLIDGDMRNADLHRYFGGGNQNGLSQALSSQAKSLQGLLSPHAVLDTLFLLPAGAKPNLPTELFSSAAFDRLLAEARANFDWVLIDSPPFLPFADAAVLSAKVDAVLPVIRSGVTSRSMLTTVTTLLQRMRAPVIGFVLNGVKEDTMSPLYSYGYHRKTEDEQYAQV